MTDRVVGNQNISYSNSNLGVLHPPDYIPKPHIYSNSEANETYNKMQQDLYISGKKAHKPKRKFPLILKIIGAIAIAAGSCLILKKPIANLYNKIFKKHI